MKRNFFHTPLFVYKNEVSARGGTPETQQPPKAPSASDVTKKNEAAAEGLKDAVSVRPAPKANAPRPRLKFNAVGERVNPPSDNTPTPTPEKAADTGPVPRNNVPRPRLKFNAAGERVDTPPPTTNAPTTGSHEKPPETPTSDTPKPPEKPRDPDREYATYHRADGSQETVSRRNGGAWRTASSDGKRERMILGQDQNIHPETPIQPSKSTAPAKALQTPPPSTPKQTPPAPSKDKQSPSEGARVSEPAQKTPAAPERKAVKGISPIESTEELHQPVSPEDKESPKTATPKKDQKAKTYEEENADFQTRMNRGDYEGSPGAFKAGLEHAERVDTLRSGTETKKETATPSLTEEEKISTSKPEESKKTKSLSEPDVQSNKGILAPPITEKPKPAEAEKASTTDAPLSAEEVKATPTPATEASKNTPSIKNEPPLPANIEQGNEAVITVDGKSIPLTREDPDSPWRDGDGVPYGDALVAGSMKKNNAETPATENLQTPGKSASTDNTKESDQKPPETPHEQEQERDDIVKIAQPGGKNKYYSEQKDGTYKDSKGVSYSREDVMKMRGDSTPNSHTKEAMGEKASDDAGDETKTPQAQVSATKKNIPTSTEIISDPVIGGEKFDEDREDSDYQGVEKKFVDKMKKGEYTKTNDAGEETFTPEGRTVFRKLLEMPRTSNPDNLFSRADIGMAISDQTIGYRQGKNGPNDKVFRPFNPREESFDAMEKRFLENRKLHRDLADSATPENTQTIVAHKTHNRTFSEDVYNRTPETIEWDTGRGVYFGGETADPKRFGDYKSKVPGVTQLMVFSTEKNALGQPKYGARVFHPDDPQVREIQSGQDGRRINFYEAEINGQRVYLQMLGQSFGNNASSLSYGDMPAGPKRIVKPQEIINEGIY